MTTKQNFWVETIEKRKKDITTLLPTIVENKDSFFKNTDIAIKRNPDLLKYTYDKSKCIRLVTEIEKLARIGLTIGGHKPQAYIVPFKDHPVAIPTADGYKFVVTAGKLPLFKSIELFKIFKDDKFKLDEANGIFDKEETTGEKFNVPEKDFVGFVFVGVLKTGERVVKKVTKDTIDNQHKKFSKQSTGSIWTNHYMRMAEKSAMKHVLRDYIFMCEGLASIEDFEGLQHEKSIDEKASLIDVDSFEVGAEIVEEEKVIDKKEKKSKTVGEIL